MTYPIPQAVLQQNIIALGKTGAGKSSALRVVVEQMLIDKLPICIIDPKGDWWGMKLSADGKSPGFPLVIFGGKHADVPINEHSGAHIAELFAQGNRPCIIDLRGWMPAARSQFFIDFASTLFQKNVGRRWVLPDEVHNFAPKGKVLDPLSGKCLHWANRLASEGRGLGVNLIGASQRPQKVHNDFLTSCETLIAMRVLHKSDRDAYKDWIDGCGDPAKGKEMLNTIANLKRGTAFVWSPEIEFGPELVKFPMFKTYDSFKPQEEGQAAKLTGWAEVNLDEVKAKLATVVKDAEANDPKALKARIAELEREQCKPKEQAVDLDLLSQERAGGFADGYKTAKREQWGEVRHELINRLTNMKMQIQDQIIALVDSERERLRFERDSGDGFVSPTPPLRPNSLQRLQAVVEKLSATTPVITKANESHSSTGDLQPVQQRILNALAELEQLGSASPDRELVAFMAGYSHVNSKGFANAIGALNSAGLTQSASGAVALTPTGRLQAQPPAKPRTAAELQERIINMLGGASGRVLRPLINAYPKSLARQALAEAADYGHVNSKGFANAIGRLRTLGFIDYPDRGTIVAKPVLFLEGR